MSVVMIQSKVKPEHVPDLEAALAKLFAAVEQAKPSGVRYASSRLSDGETYVALLQLDEGVENPLPALPEFGAFQQQLQGWAAGPPTVEPLTVVGSYRLF